tara:strand:+ start:988 stop:2550 length:1563 start_codon:yes stop_codon:yes gene_type:complete
MSISSSGEAKTKNLILVVNFGAQYSQLIARRVRESHVYSEIVSHDLDAQAIADLKPSGIIFSGGPSSVNVKNAPLIDPSIYELGVPILGICYGAQLIAQQNGGLVKPNKNGEYGRTDLDVTEPGALFADIGTGQQQVWMSHFDSIVDPPSGAIVTAISQGSPVAVFENTEELLYGVQFHPEVNHTPCGFSLLQTFVNDICGCPKDWDMTSVIESSVSAIRKKVVQKSAICGLSGGVDSAVAAALVHRAVGSQLTCVFIDTGLMRKDEADQVVQAFESSQGVDLIHVKAADRFFQQLKGVTDPEKKRKIIGELFIRLFEEVAKNKKDTRFLVQGTLYPDVIESGTNDAARIKSHHNVGGLPDDMDFELVEPLRNLFKDEVRSVGKELGLPDEIIKRQPFPGPGLAVRIIGEVTPETVEIVRSADSIVQDEIKSSVLADEVWQAFAVLADIKSVGVMGDERTYARPIILRAVTSEDAMTADWARLPHDLLESISSRIISEVSGVNRVVYDITSKPPGTIEWE